MSSIKTIITTKYLPLGTSGNDNQTVTWNDTLKKFVFTSMCGGGNVSVTSLSECEGIVPVFLNDDGTSLGISNIKADEVVKSTTTLTNDAIILGNNNKAIKASTVTISSNILGVVDAIKFDSGANKSELKIEPLKDQQNIFENNLLAILGKSSICRVLHAIEYLGIADNEDYTNIPCINDVAGYPLTELSKKEKVVFRYYVYLEDDVSLTFDYRQGAFRLDYDDQLKEYSLTEIYSEQTQTIDDIKDCDHSFYVSNQRLFLSLDLSTTKYPNDLYVKASLFEV